MKRSIVAMSMFAVLATGNSAACAKQDSSTQIGPTEAASSSTTVETSTPAKPPGHVGDTLDMTRADGGKIAVTLLQVINPATVTEGAAESGKTYVATKLKLTDSGTMPVEGDVNVNVALVGSDDQSYTADFNNVTECTNFESGAFHLDADESATGCVVFALPHGVSPVRVKYTPSAGFADDFGEWLVK